MKKAISLMIIAILAIFFINLKVCGDDPTRPSVDSDVPDAGPLGNSVINIQNLTDSDTTVHVTFGSDSVITGWEFCTPDKKGEAPCHFTLDPQAGRHLPTHGKYINATFAFDSVVGCGATKAEVNANNPKWYSIIDVSLVDGYSNRIQATVQPSGDAGVDAAILGPPVGDAGNEAVYGLYPYGCDLCVSRSNPPCGISKGTDGCKAGTQYDPKPPCQYQGLVMGGGETIWIQLIE